MPIPQFSPDVDWPTLGRLYRTGMFLGTLFELMAQGYVLALVSRYFSLVKQRRATAIEQIAISTACIIGVTQMCIHFQSMYHNGIANYLQVTLLALDDHWQIQSIWVMSGIVWAISNGMLVWHWRKAEARVASFACLLLVAVPALSGLAVTIMRTVFPVHAIATVTGSVTLPPGFESVKPVLYLHYGLNIVAQLLLSAFAFPRARNSSTAASTRWQYVSTMCHYYKHLMPGKNLELIAFLPFSAVSLANVMAILDDHALAARGTESACSSQSDSLKCHSAAKNRVVIPVERTEVVDVSDKDAAYGPTRIGLNRLPYSSSRSTMSNATQDNEKVSLNRVGADVY